MTEEEARDRVTANVPRETAAKIDRYVNILQVEATRHNLIAPSTLPVLWVRHILDSAQLVALAPPIGEWIDVGSGAGLPGIVVAILRDAPVMLVEPRRLRAEFLRRLAEDLGITDRVSVAAMRIERVSAGAATCISARAVAPLGTLFGMASHLADARTCWVLPKGRSAAEEVATARESWQCAFELVPSATDPDARIVVARGVRRREGR